MKRVLMTMIFVASVQGILLGQSSAKREPITKEMIGEIMSTVRNGGTAGTAAAIAQTGKMGYPPYKVGLVMRKRGYNDDAIAWFVAMVDHHSELADKQYYYYYKAWILFKMGRFKEALEDGETLLETKPQKLTLARTQYLLGKIYLQWDQFKDATSYLKAAMKTYGKLKKSGGQYLATKGLAEVAIYQSDYEVGLKLIDQAEEYRRVKNFYSEGFLLDLRAEILFRQHKFKEYIRPATLALVAHQNANDADNALWMNIKIAMAHAFSCNLHVAREMAMANTDVIIETNNVLAQQYNTVTRIIFRKNWNENPQELIDFLQGLIESGKVGADLVDLFALAKTVKCDTKE